MIGAFESVPGPEFWMTFLPLTPRPSSRKIAFPRIPALSTCYELTGSYERIVFNLNWLILDIFTPDCGVKPKKPALATNNP